MSALAPAPVSDLPPTPMATPRLGSAGLPPLPPAPITPITPAPVVPMTRKQAREDRHLQYLEEERLDDERALVSITNQVITLHMPFETVKTEFEDLDGLAHSALFSRPSRPVLPPRAESPPVMAHIHHPHDHTIPPLTSDATIRAARANRRVHLAPTAFKAPGSPQLDSPLGRKPSSRRNANILRRRSAEREAWLVRLS